MSRGRTGITTPSATMSSRTQTKMNPSAARRRNSPPAPPSCSLIPSHKVDSETKPELRRSALRDLPQRGKVRAPEVGQAQQQELVREAMARGAVGRHLVEPAMLDADAGLVAGGLETHLHFGVKIWREVRLPIG